MVQSFYMLMLGCQLIRQIEYFLNVRLSVFAGKELFPLFYTV